VGQQNKEHPENLLTELKTIEDKSITVGFTEGSFYDDDQIA